MDALFSNLIGLGLPGAFIALTVWYTRRYDLASERTMKVLEADRDRWMRRALECEEELKGCKEGKVST